MTKQADHARYGTVPGIRPVFLSGVYRSGTTFLAALVNCHPRYAATSSSVKFMRFCLDRFDPVESAENYRALIDECRRRVGVRWGMDFDAERIVADVESRGVSYAVLYDSIMRHALGDAAADCDWAEKTAVLWTRVPDFLSMFPDGRVIHIFRDPRDVTASYKMMTNEPGLTYLDAAFNCLHAMASLERYVERFGSERILILRSEDLSADPPGKTREICDFLEIAHCDRMLQPEKYGEIPGEDWKSNTSFGDEIAPFADFTGRWVNHLTATETAFVELVTQPMAARYGYIGAGEVPDRAVWNGIYDLLEDPFIRERFGAWLRTGEGGEGYRTDPYTTEMRIVFPERFLEQTDHKVPAGG